MQFMLLMIPKVYQDPKGDRTLDFAPPPEAVARMTKYNERLAKAGALLAGDGLHPPEEGVRVAFHGGKPQVTDGPYAESKEVLGGYWIIRADSKEEAVEWVKQCPADDGDVIEIRQVFDVAEWPEDARKAAENETVREAVEANARRTQR